MIELVRIGKELIIIVLLNLVLGVRKLEKIEFIGVKEKGKWMVRKLMRAGFEVNMFVREKDSINDLLVSGGVYKSTIAKCIDGCNKIITFSDFPCEQEEDIFGTSNIVESAMDGAYIVSIDTRQELSCRLEEEGKKRGLHIVHALSTGDTDNAKYGTTVYNLSGDDEDIEVCRSLFEAMGTIE